MPICSRDEIKTDYLNIALTDNTLDKTLDRFIEVAQMEIEGICDQPIIAAATTWTQLGTTDRLLRTGYTVPMTLTAVQSRGNFTDAFVAITDTASVVDVNSVKHLATTGTWTAAQYQITATLGYATVPRVIQMCACELVVEMYYNTTHAGSGSRFGVSAISESAGGTSMSKTVQSMRARIMPRLTPYRRVSI